MTNQQPPVGTLPQGYKPNYPPSYQPYDYSGHMPQQYQQPVVFQSNDQDLQWYRWLEQSQNARQLNVAYILLFFFGSLGVHRFYLHKVGTGWVWLLTGGCVGIGVLCDIFRLRKMTRDSNVLEWQKTR